MAKRYDVAIIGSGPAGLSAAINAKVRNKEIIVFGSKELSTKLSKAHGINNYLGMYGKTGKEMVEAFKSHILAMDIEITEEKVTNILQAGDYYSLLTKNDMYEAKTIILASGVNFGKPLPGEKEFLGKGVSYCATCDAFAYRGKKAVVVGYGRFAEEEADFLTQVAAKVYYIPMYKEAVNVNENVTVIRENVMKVIGSEQVTEVVLTNSTIQTDGVFILRENAAPDQLLNGLRIEDNHISVDRLMRTNLAGCFAAGDIVGKPYQYIKAAGEGNIAALSAVAYIDEK